MTDTTVVMTDTAVAPGLMAGNDRGPETVIMDENQGTSVTTIDGNKRMYCPNKIQLAMIILCRTTNNL
jgi:hypothetical protein